MKMFKVVCAAVAGNTLEVYDIIVYGFFASIIAQNFFPTEGKLVGIASTFGIFLLGYLSRALGAIFFGRMGDNFGRKPALTTSIWLMALSTFALGLLPTYAAIGVWAPLLLLMVRLLQGFSCGGELTGSIIFLVEHSPRANRGFYGSFGMLGMGSGILLASLVTWLIYHNFSPAAVVAWAWRLPYLLALLGGLVAWLINRGVDETASFIKTQRMPWNHVTLYHQYAKQMGNVVIIVGLLLSASALLYLIYIFSFTYMTVILRYTLYQALSTNILSVILLLLLVPWMGKLSDWIGRRLVMALALIGSMIWIWPYFLLIQQNNIAIALLAQLIMTLFAATYLAVGVVTMVEIVPVHMRFSIVAFTYALAAGLFGGATPFIATLLIRATNSYVSLACYLMICMLISLVAVYKVRETQYTSNTDEEDNYHDLENNSSKGKISTVAKQLQQ